MKYIKFETNGTGYRDAFFSSGWRIAFVDYCAAHNDIKSVTYIEKHLETEESFLLLKGKAYLITAGKGEKPEQFQATQLQPHILCVVERKEWHVTIFSKDAEVLIVENAEESPSLSFSLSKDILGVIYEKIRNEIAEQT